jgi:transglutaminase-like putative cysteine protease
VTEQDYLGPTRHVESDAPQIVEFARAAVAGAAEDVEQAVRIYSAVRDRIAYDPYDRFDDGCSFSALRALQRRRGSCIPKAALLVASARALGIAGRLGFADVRNHLASRRLTIANNGDIFRWHCYAELLLGGRWVKATPAFDLALCERGGIVPLGFDGTNDSVFHPFDRSNRRHMEYVLERGSFAGVPVEAILDTWRQHSPGLFDASYLRGAKAFAEEIEAPR